MEKTSGPGGRPVLFLYAFNASFPITWKFNSDVLYQNIHDSHYLISLSFSDIHGYPVVILLQRGGVGQSLEHHMVQLVGQYSICVPSDVDSK